jgi:hypothetical protein
VDGEDGAGLELDEVRTIAVLALDGGGADAREAGLDELMVCLVNSVESHAMYLGFRQGIGLASALRQ